MGMDDIQTSNLFLFPSIQQVKCNCVFFSLVFFNAFLNVSFVLLMYSSQSSAFVEYI